MSYKFNGFLGFSHLTLVKLSSYRFLIDWIWPKLFLPCTKHLDKVGLKFSHLVQNTWIRGLEWGAGLSKFGKKLAISLLDNNC
jgi:hypothetical protein